MGTKSSASDSKASEITSLEAREGDIQEQLKRLEDFVENEPKRARQAEEDRMCTIPAPSEVKERLREKQFMERLSRGELKNEKRHQAKSGLLITLLVIATASIALWIYRMIQ